MDHSGRIRPYHHGALRDALIEAGIALARDGGPDRVILREAARAAGVSPTAVYRHFADREALLAEVSRHARGQLAAEMRRRIDRIVDPAKRLRAIGTAYVDFALAQPGLFRTAFVAHRPAPCRIVEYDAPGGAEPFEILGQVLDQAQAAGLLDRGRRPGAEIVVWSTVHGLACLLLDGTVPAARADVELALGRIFDLVGRGLLSQRGDSARTDAPAAGPRGRRRPVRRVSAPGHPGEPPVVEPRGQPHTPVEHHERTADEQ